MACHSRGRYCERSAYSTKVGATLPPVTSGSGGWTWIIRCLVVPVVKVRRHSSLWNTPITWVCLDFRGPDITHKKVCFIFSWCCVTNEKKGIIWDPPRRLCCVIFHLKSSRAQRAVYCALSSKIGSFSGQCVWSTDGKTDTEQRHAEEDAAAQTWAGLGRKEQAASIAAGERQHHSRPASRPNMCPVTEKQTTYLRAVPLPPISTSQSLEMDHRHRLALAHTNWKLLCHTQHALPAPFPSSTSPFTQSHKLCKWPLLGVP